MCSSILFIHTDTSWITVMPFYVVIGKRKLIIYLENMQTLTADRVTHQRETTWNPLPGNS